MKFNIQLYKDYCKILGIKPTSTSDQIKSSFRQRVKILRPDIRLESAEEFNLVKNAYDYLLKFNERATEILKNSKKYETTSRARFSPDWSFFKSVQDDTIFKNRNQLEPLELSLEIDFYLAIHGGEKETHLNIQDACECKSEYYCKVCDRTGLVTNYKKLTLKIPCGTDKNQILILKQAGNYNPLLKRRQDIHFRINIAPEPNKRFTRSGMNLHTQVRVEYSQAVLKKPVCVPTLGANHIFTPVQVIQNGATMILNAQGAPKFSDSNTRGDLFVTFIIQAEETLTTEERELLEQLYELRNQANKSG